jgi:hypothetical protein
MLRIFICYAHKDNDNPDLSKRWLDRLLEQLAPLQLQDKAEIWSDEKIELGDDWHEKIQSVLQEVKAAVLLISPSFLASEYIKNHELPVLLKNAKDRGVVIIPILLRQCLWKDTQFNYPDPKNSPGKLSLSSLQAPTGKPLNSLQEDQQDQALYDVAKSLLQIVSSSPSSIGTSINNQDNPPVFLPLLGNLELNSSVQKNSGEITLASEKGIDYTNLQNFLKQQKWKEADEETGRVMREAAGVEEDLGWLDEESINNFPCEDLCTIDSLWKYYSNEKFGFSLQKEIYERLRETQENDRYIDIWGDFCDRVVWRREKKWLSGSELTFSLTAAPRGHFPSFFENPFDTLNMDSFAYFFCCLMQKIKSCYDKTDCEF